MAVRRAAYDKAEQAFALPDGGRAVPWREGALGGERIEVDGAMPGRWLLYLHGGGYGIGSPRSHRHLAAALGRAAHAQVLVPDYRLAPEHVFPAAIDDALAAYRHLLAQTPATKIAIAGDSAGGGLTLATMLAARAAGLALPAAAACLSPWADLGRRWRGDDLDADPLVRAGEIAGYAEAYLAGTAATDPLASPVHADLAGLPPLLIEAGAGERLADDARRLATRADACGVEATLTLVAGVPHVWHWFWPRLALGREAVARVGAFLERRLAA